MSKKESDEHSTVTTVKTVDEEIKILLYKSCILYDYDKSYEKS